LRLLVNWGFDGRRRSANSLGESRRRSGPSLGVSRHRSIVRAGHRGAHLVFERGLHRENLVVDRGLRSGCCRLSIAAAIGGISSSIACRPCPPPIGARGGPAPIVKDISSSIVEEISSLMEPVITEISSLSGPGAEVISSIAGLGRKDLVVDRGEGPRTSHGNLTVERPLVGRNVVIGRGLGSRTSSRQAGMGLRTHGLEEIGSSARARIRRNLVADWGVGRGKSRRRSGPGSTGKGDTDKGIVKLLMTLCVRQLEVQLRGQARFVFQLHL